MVESITIIQSPLICQKLEKKLKGPPQQGKEKGKQMMYNLVKRTINKNQVSFPCTKCQVTYRNRAGYGVTVFDLMVLRYIQTSS
jgi:hypothetical protein